MITVTDAAKNRIVDLMATKEEDDLALRVAITGRQAGLFVYRMGIVGLDKREQDDVVVEADGFEILIDPGSAANLEGATMDFVEEKSRSGFKIDNPNPLWSDPTALAVQKLIDEEINPDLAAHGGIVSLVAVKDKVAYVAFGGGCQGCSMVDVTLEQGVEARIKDSVPEIVQVVDTTDHARGANPCG